MNFDNGARRTPLTDVVDELRTVPERSDGGFLHLDSLETESLMMNVDHSLGVRARHHFFAWTQGPLQSLIRHEMLMCAVRARHGAPVHVDTFSTAPRTTARVNELFLNERSPLPSSLKQWKRNHCEPVLLPIEDPGSNGTSRAAQVLKQLGATHIAAHGTHDANGEWTSLFMFVCNEDMVRPSLVNVLQLVIPFVHAAWVRTLVKRRPVRANERAIDPLTARQQEIVQWIFHGKNNAEIALILKTSPLTVKNHVQRILRKLHVTNRAQALGKALALGMIDP